MTQHFSSVFQRAAAPAARAKFLSRVFGIFSEQIVSLWASDERAPYQNLGRPTLKSDHVRGHTLDFALKDRSTGCNYVAEMKCEIEYQKFRYFVLERAEQLDHHKKPAFDAFLNAAANPSNRKVFVRGRQVQCHGAVLIWGSVTPEGRSAVMASKGFHDVLSVANICRDLSAWRHAEYAELLMERQAWCNDLFGELLQANVEA